MGGHNLGFAALLLSEGMKDEAYRTPGGFITSSTRPKATGSARPKPGTYGKLSRRHVHAAGGDLGDGNDPPTIAGFTEKREYVSPHCPKTPS